MDLWVSKKIKERDVRFQFLFYSGVLTGAGAGVIRCIHGNGDLVSDLIPCDFVVNCIIVAGASVASNSTNEFKVYNCTSSKLLPITWNEFLDLGKMIKI